MVVTAGFDRYTSCQLGTHRDRFLSPSPPIKRYILSNYLLLGSNFWDLTQAVSTSAPRPIYLLTDFYAGFYVCLSSMPIALIVNSPTIPNYCSFEGFNHV